jgi:hypothetical protein
MRDGWYVVQTWNKKASFRIGLKDGVVIRTAPYGQSLMNKHWEKAAEWGSMEWFADFDTREKPAYGE